MTDDARNRGNGDQPLRPRRLVPLRLAIPRDDDTPEERAAKYGDALLAIAPRINELAEHQDKMTVAVLSLEHGMRQLPEETREVVRDAVAPLAADMAVVRARVLGAETTAAAAHREAMVTSSFAKPVVEAARAMAAKLEAQSNDPAHPMTPEKAREIADKAAVDLRDADELREARETRDNWRKLRWGVAAGVLVAACAGLGGALFSTCQHEAALIRRAELAEKRAAETAQPAATAAVPEPPASVAPPVAPAAVAPGHRTR